MGSSVNHTKAVRRAVEYTGPFRIIKQTDTFPPRNSYSESNSPSFTDRKIEFHQTTLEDKYKKGILIDKHY